MTEQTPEEPKKTPETAAPREDDPNDERPYIVHVTWFAIATVICYALWKFLLK
jgi:hypothetical protein